MTKGTSRGQGDRLWRGETQHAEWLEDDGSPEIIDISDDDDVDAPQQVCDPIPLSRVSPCGIWEILRPGGEVPGVAEWVGARIGVEQRVNQGRLWLKPYLRQWVDVGLMLPSSPWVPAPPGGSGEREREERRRSRVGPSEVSGDRGPGSVKAHRGNFWGRYAAFEAACDNWRRGGDLRAQGGQQGQVEEGHCDEIGGADREDIDVGVEGEVGSQSVSGIREDKAEERVRGKGEIATEVLQGTEPIQGRVGECGQEWLLSKTETAVEVGDAEDQREDESSADTEMTVVIVNGSDQWSMETEVIGDEASHTEMEAEVEVEQPYQTNAGSTRVALGGTESSQKGEDKIEEDWEEQRRGDRGVDKGVVGANQKGMPAAGFCFDCQASEVNSSGPASLLAEIPETHRSLTGARKKGVEKVQADDAVEEPSKEGGGSDVGEVRGKEDEGVEGMEDTEQGTSFPMEVQHQEAYAWKEYSEELDVQEGEQAEGTRTWEGIGMLKMGELKQCFVRRCCVTERGLEYGNASDDDHRLGNIQDILDDIPGMADDLLWARRKGTEVDQEWTKSLINKTMEELKSTIWQLGGNAGNDEGGGKSEGGGECN